MCVTNIALTSLHPLYPPSTPTMQVIIAAIPNLMSGVWISKVVFWNPDGIFKCLPIFSLAFSCQTLDSSVCMCVCVCVCVCVYIHFTFFGFRTANCAYKAIVHEYSDTRMPVSVYIQCHTSVCVVDIVCTCVSVYCGSRPYVYHILLITY